MARPPRNGSTSAWRAVRTLVLARDNYQCRIKGRNCEGRANTVDHIVPYAKGGSDDPSNLRSACKSCNYGRRDSAPPTITTVTNWDE